ncbi:hypothetical protein Taro_043886 [Colocasia esculenta]|uniref:Uncharacterized protein n=1 Tax=Colocasia esculenta TaxID=4460 RepID=A0A843WSI5_COLES|nr:hypothetical protein [Colocasia esculenta]
MFKIPKLLNCHRNMYIPQTTNTQSTFLKRLLNGPPCNPVTTLSAISTTSEKCSRGFLNLVKPKSIAFFHHLYATLDLPLPFSWPGKFELEGSEVADDDVDASDAVQRVLESAAPADAVLVDEAKRSLFSG